MLFPRLRMSQPTDLRLCEIARRQSLTSGPVVITESIVPGTNTLAERLSLGSGDPFERFRRHFYQTMKRVCRPVMVIIDDLDRCKPGFVVDLY